MTIYDVIIKAGTITHKVVVRGRSHEEAESAAMLITRTSERDLEFIMTAPREHEAHAGMCDLNNPICRQHLDEKEARCSSAGRMKSRKRN